MRDLLSGRQRSLIPTSAPAAAPLFGTTLLRTTGANPTFDPVITRSSGSAPTWDMGDTTQYATTDSISHSYAAPGDYEVRWDLVDATLRIAAFTNDDITAITAQAGWVNMEQFNLSSNGSLGNVTTHKEWTKLEQLTLPATGCTALDTHVEWTALTSIEASLNTSLTSVPTHAAWTLMEDINLNACSSLSAITVYSAWTAFWFFWVHNCNFSAATIDAFLIALDGSGKINGNLKYEGNPGSADPSRSGPAATAKANLAGKGWTITN
jgi:hypothetical protein